jgi:triacylglycerol lipase
MVSTSEKATSLLSVLVLGQVFPLVALFFLMACAFQGCETTTIPGEQPGTSHEQGHVSDAHTTKDRQRETSPTEPPPEQSGQTTENPTPPEWQPNETQTTTETQTEPPREVLPERPVNCPTPSTIPPIDRPGGAWSVASITTNPVSDSLPACGSKRYKLVASATQTYQIDLMGLPLQGPYRLFVYDARRMNQIATTTALATADATGKGYASVTFEVVQSGEIAIVVQGESNPNPVPFQLHVICRGFCQLQSTRYPIVLMHGFMGTDKYFGLLDYFYQVKTHLTDMGYSVFTPKVQPIANSTQRVLTLKKQIDDIFLQTGAKKLNLIAHSQGGVDGRLLIAKHKYGSKIASLTTISTPHRGVPIPNLLLPPSQELGESNMKKYNQLYPNDPLVKYFSWAGVSCGFLDRDCRKKYNDETIDPLLVGTYNTLKAMRGPNDGIVTLDSAKWGTFLGEIPADHFDEIGQVADKNNKSFDHKAFYATEAKRLQKLDF